MNNRLLKYTTILGTAVAVIAFTGCSKEERSDLVEATKDTYHNAKDAVAKGFENVKEYTFEKRDDLTAEFNARQKELEADVSDLKADYSAETASASRKAAMDELKNADADFKQKLAALGDATTDTWDAARDRTAAAWDRLQAAYANARAAN